MAHHVGMRYRLGSLLDTSDLPRAELCALRLAGEAFDVDDCLRPIDLPDTAELRASAFALLAPVGVVADGPSALWIYGIRSGAPAEHTACVGLDRPMGSPHSPRLRVRQVGLSAQDVRTVGPARVLSPLRTLLDLTRLSEQWSLEQSAATARLIAVGALSADDWEGRLDNPRHLPYKQRASTRIAEAIQQFQPALTR